MNDKRRRRRNRQLFGLAFTFVAVATITGLAAPTLQTLLTGLPVLVTFSAAVADISGLTVSEFPQPASTTPHNSTTPLPATKPVAMPATATVTAAASPVPLPSATPTPTATASATKTLLPSATQTATATLTHTGTDTATNTPLPAPTACTPAGTGLLAEYHDTLRGFDNRRLARVEGPIDFDWRDGAPAFSYLSGDFFSVRWTGQLLPAESGDYTFYLGSDDGIRFYINGALLIDAWRDRRYAESVADVTLDGCQLYNITIEYYEHSNVARVSFAWQAPALGIEKAIVPLRYLYPAP